MTGKSIKQKSIKQIGNTNEFLIASSIAEPTVAKVLKIQEDGTTIWHKKYPQMEKLFGIRFMEIQKEELIVSLMIT